MKRLLPLVLCSCSLLGGGNSRPFAEWKVHGSARPAGTCATIEPWVVKSGAEGVGFVLEVRGRASCSLAPKVVELQLGDQVLHDDVTIPPATMTDGAVLRLYAPFPFDNRAAWNRGSRTAVLFVRGTIDGAPFESGPWTLDHQVPP